MASRIETAALPPSWARSYETHRPRYRDERIRSPVRSVRRRTGLPRMKMKEKRHVAEDTDVGQRDDEYYYKDHEDEFEFVRKRARERSSVGEIEWAGDRREDEMARDRERELARVLAEIERGKAREKRHLEVEERNQPSFRARPRVDVDIDEAAPGLPVFYSFLPSSKARKDLHGGAVSDIESIAAVELDQAPPPGHGVAAYHVFESECTEYADNHPTVRLSGVLSERTQPQALFRWIHITRQSMDIEDFSTQLSRVAGLTHTERIGIDKLLDGIKRDGIKPIQASNKKSVRHMEPKFRREDLGDPNGQTSPRTVSWICLPYFSLEPYSGLLGSKDPKAFPNQTLLQAKFTRTTRKRDMQQAVCEHKGPKGQCFHVAQLWCLVLDDSLLFTYGRITEDVLCKGFITKTVKPIADSPEATSKPALSVRYQANMVWSIPLDECQTWVAFASHFCDFHPRRLEFFRHDKLVQPGDWPKILQTVTRSSTRVMLDLHIGPVPIPPQLGVLPSPRQPKQDREPTSPFQNQPSSSKPQIQSQTTPPLPNPPPEQQPPFPVFTRLPDISLPSPSTIPATSSLKPPSQNRNRNPTPPKPPASPIVPPTPLVPPAAPQISTTDADKPNSSTSTSTSTPTSTTLQSYFKEVDECLRDYIVPSDGRAYVSCPESGRAEVYGLLEKEGQRRRQRRVRFADEYEHEGGGYEDEDKSEEGGEENGGEERGGDGYGHGGGSGGDDDEYGARVNLFNLADVVFRGFFPADAEVEGEGAVPSVNKFWGGVRGLVEFGFNVHKHDSDPRAWSRAFSQVAGDLHHIVVDIMAFNEVFAHVQDADRARIQTPLVLVNAWMHLVLGLATCLTDLARSGELLTHAGSDVKQGLRAMMEGVNGTGLKLPAVLPLDLVSLLGMRLLKDVTGELDNISGIYWAYSLSIESDIISKSDRLHEQRLDMVKQEGGIIRWVVDVQKIIVDKMLVASSSTGGSAEDKIVDIVSPWPQSGSPYAHQAKGSFREVFLQETLNNLDERASDFNGLDDFASGLITTNRTKLNYAKDRQERAIYAFTIVTIIFLPLSAVSSIFGMNTVDIREMELNQWAYWAAAVPVTVVVIILGLVFTLDGGAVSRFFWGLVGRLGWGNADKDVWGMDYDSTGYDEKSSYVEIR